MEGIGECAVYSVLISTSFLQGRERMITLCDLDRLESVWEIVAGHKKIIWLAVSCDLGGPWGLRFPLCRTSKTALSQKEHRTDTGGHGCLKQPFFLLASQKEAQLLVRRGCLKILTEDTVKSACCSSLVWHAIPTIVNLISVRELPLDY